MAKAAGPHRREPGSQARRILRYGGRSETEVGDKVDPPGTSQEPGGGDTPPWQGGGEEPPSGEVQVQGQFLVVTAPGGKQAPTVLNLWAQGEGSPTVENPHLQDTVSAHYSFRFFLSLSQSFPVFISLFQSFSVFLNICHKEKYL